ncbi:MAG: aminopeptidase [Candidatus Thorarchaeota archaeon]
MEPKIAAANALYSVLEARAGESVLVICDTPKMDVATGFAEGALDLGLWTRVLALDVREDEWRTEIPHHLLEIINGPRPPDIYVNLLRGPAQETAFRVKLIRLETRKRTSRLGHCPGITIDMLTEGALALTREEYVEMQGSARQLLTLLQNVETVHVRSASGSDFSLGVSGRTWFSDTYLDWKTMKWMNLPTGEVIVGPIENSMEGTLVCDLAVGGIGPIRQPVRIQVEKGKVRRLESQDSHALEIIRQVQATDEMAKYVGEFAIGLNPRARVVREFLESEKVGGTIHVAFGNNMDYPGTVTNNSSTHQDFLVSRPTVDIRYADGSERTLMRDGRLTI